jgi:IclR family acetate operon transcriptional repressor
MSLASHGPSRTPVPTAASAAVKSADRALAIVDHIAQHGPLRFNQLVADLGIPRSSIHALLHTLVARRWLEFDEETRRYSIGLQAWQVGKSYTGHGDLLAVARPVMDRLAADIGQTIQLARLDGLENVYIAISESEAPMRLASTVGSRLMAHATGLGKALLSQLSPEESARRIRAVDLARFTEATVTDPDQLDALVAEARTRGYALDVEELLVGCRCVAVPLMETDGMITALSATTLSQWAGPEWPAPELEQLRIAAGIIRARVGIAG